MQEKKTLIIGGIACGICLCLASNFQTVRHQVYNRRKSRLYHCLLYCDRPCHRTVPWQKMHEIYLGCRCNGSDRTLSPVHHRWIFHWKGDLLVLVCAFLFSLHILVIDYFSPKVDGVKLSCIQFLTCGVLSGIPALLLEHPELSSILAAWQPILYAGVMSCGVAYTLQIIGQKNMNQL